MSKIILAIIIAIAGFALSYVISNELASRLVLIAAGAAATGLVMAKK